MRSEKSILIIALLLTCACVNAVYAADPIFQGSGTGTDPYQISTPAELIYLADNDEFYSDDFILTADIDLTATPFTTAVIALQEFDGIFNGNYHKIINLTIDAQSSNANNLGLFGETGSNAKIMNLGLENVTITTGATSNAIGAMVGWCGSPVINCYATGSITSGSDAYYIGGFIGANLANIENCYAEVDVIGGTNSLRLGGFTGYNGGSYINCYATGSVSGSLFVGGFVGQSLFGYFSSCYHLHPDDGGGPVDTHAIALTDTQMKNQASFIEWDFIGETLNGMDETWTMDGYPVLSWQMPVGLREYSILAAHWGQTYIAKDDPGSRADWHEDKTLDINDLGLLAEYWLERVIEKSYPFTLDDDFETADFTKQPWVLGGSGDWVIDDVTFQQGAYSARSGGVGDSQSSYLELTVDTTGYDLITFYYKVSSEADFDFLRFYIDGARRIEHGGETEGWVYVTFPVYNSETTFKWSYDKDSSGYGGQDCIWIDNIIFTRE